MIRRTIDDRDFERICRAASDARNRLWGYHHTLERESYKRVVMVGAHDPALRAAVTATLRAVGIVPPPFIRNEPPKESTVVDI